MKKKKESNITVHSFPSSTFLVNQAVKILEPLLPPTKRPDSRRKVPPYIYSLQLDSVQPMWDFQHSSHGSWVFPFSFSSPSKG